MSALDKPPAAKPFLKLFCMVAAFLAGDPLSWGLIFVLAFWDIALDMRTAALLAYPKVTASGATIEALWLLRSRRCAHAVGKALNAFLSNVGFYAFLFVMCGVWFVCLGLVLPIGPWYEPLAAASYVLARSLVFVALLVYFITKDLFLRRWRRLDRLFSAGRATVFFVAGAILALPFIDSLLGFLLRVLWLVYALGTIHLVRSLGRSLGDRRTSYYAMALGEDERARVRSEHMARLAAFLSTVFGQPEPESQPLEEPPKVRLLSYLETFAIAGAIAALALLAWAVARSLPGAR